MEVYPLAIQHNYGLNHDFEWDFVYFDWPMFNSYVNLPEGKRILKLQLIDGLSHDSWDSKPPTMIDSVLKTTSFPQNMGFSCKFAS